MQDDQKHLLVIQLRPTTTTRMVSCRTAGRHFRGFIGHSRTGLLDDPSYHELVCDTACRTSGEAMRTAHDLARILALRYGYSGLPLISGRIRAPRPRFSQERST